MQRYEDRGVSSPQTNQTEQKRENQVLDPMSALFRFEVHVEHTACCHERTFVLHRYYMLDEEEQQDVTAFWTKVYPEFLDNDQMGDVLSIGDVQSDVERWGEWYNDEGSDPIDRYSHETVFRRVFLEAMQNEYGDKPVSYKTDMWDPPGILDMTVEWHRVEAGEGGAKDY